ncbi:MAG: tetratricopeptide repeat protein [Candidatus Omnitrophica bacterium]|nr:tetratricopeptide repeat protein [Candidatus Omnitrophota bacterium]
MSKKLLLFILLLVIGFSYLPLLRSDFVDFDDYNYIVNNPHVNSGMSKINLVWAFTSFHAANWHPLTWLSHMLDVEIFGLNPAGHHLINLLLHLCNVIVLFMILNYLTGSFWKSLVVAAIFGLHPINVETVAWISQRKSVLSSLFFLLSVWAYAAYVKKPHPARYGVLLVFFVFGLMAKPIIISLPFVLLLIDFWPLNRISLANRDPKVVWRLIIEKVPLLLFSIISCFITFFAQMRGGAVVSLRTFPLYTRFANSITSYLMYMLRIVVPRHLCAYYPYPDKNEYLPALLAFLGLTIVTVILIRKREEHPWLITGWLWFLGILIPVAGIVQIGGQATADRYTYMPMIGLLISATWEADYNIQKLHLNKTIPVFSVSMLIMLFSFLSRRQSGYWHDGKTLFEHTLSVTKDNYYTHSLLGNALFREGKLEGALKHYSKALEIEPRFEPAYYNKGLVLYYLNRRDEALSMLKQATIKTPDNADIYHVLGWIYREMGRDSLAIKYFQKSISYNPKLYESHCDLGEEYEKNDNIFKALFHFSEAVRLQPDSARAYDNIAALYVRLRKVDLAIEKYEQALGRVADRWELYNNLGNIFLDIGRTSQAISLYSSAIKTAPEQAMPYYNRGRAYILINKPVKAIDDFRNAVLTDPKYIKAHYYLGKVLEAKGDKDSAMIHFQTAEYLKSIP